MKFNFRRSFETRRSHMKMNVMKWISTWRKMMGDCPFTTVAIETTTHCHRRCTYCPVSVDPKQPRAMSVALFQQIIDQLAEIEFRSRLTYHFYNEPLLNRNLEDLVAYASKQLPEAKHVIYTNGDLLTDVRADSLFASGVTSFVVTDHGGQKLTEPVQHAALGGSVFNTRIRFRRFTLDSSLFNRGGLVAIHNTRQHRSFCVYPAHELVIDVDGNVILCCNDYHAKHKFGNVMDAPLLNIWNSSEMSALRQRLWEGYFDLEICKKCAGLWPSLETEALIAAEDFDGSSN